MTIASLSDYYAAAKQRVILRKAGNNHDSASMWAGAGNPGAGSAPGNTANGLVPDNTTTGAAPINNFSGAGYVTRFETNSQQSTPPYRLVLYDRLFHAGAFAFNDSITLTAQPDFSARVPGGSYVGLQIWIEVATSFTGNPSHTVTYTDQDGNTGHTTGAFTPVQSASGPGLGSPPIAQDAWQLPLASGDSGVQKIESVTCTGLTAGTFNVVIARVLFQAWQRIGIYHRDHPDQHRWLDMAHALIYPTSCLALLGGIPSGSPPKEEVFLEIASA